MAIFITPSGAGCSCGRTECTDECGLYLLYKPEPKPITNGDKLRAMSDEKLAEFMADNCGCPVDKCPHLDDEKDCGQCWADWLRQEANA